MDKLYTLIIFLLGVNATSQVQVSGPMLELPVRLGDNITLYCDCKTSSGVYIRWYRICSHVNQPSLVLSTRYPHEMELMDKDDSNGFLNPFPRFHFVKNQSSESYDLLILNITDSDEGLYYCGTEQLKVEDEIKLNQKYVYSYSNVTTRIFLFEPHYQTNPQDCGLCWKLLFYLCPTCAVFSSLLSSLLVYHFSKKTGKDGHFNEKRFETRGLTKENQDEDVCYAALEIRQASKKVKKTESQSSDFCTYSDINTCRM
ncbi:uncharacterized protein LOC113162295 isoform X2 [Anabas testudineus]|uniref:uncharacterized protein LOC113162295 isoform X2 n=1 Tax=Anabas testudineus TaxID=64144 RepID=UPI000E465A48|nr:uncharacterized protein LOC113162295 isoform X2 [Anabas testudineus]